MTQTLDALLTELEERARKAKFDGEWNAEAVDAYVRACHPDTLLKLVAVIRRLREGLGFYAKMELQDDAFAKHYDRTNLVITDEYGDKTTVANYPGPPVARGILRDVEAIVTSEKRDETGNDSSGFRESLIDKINAISWAVKPKVEFSSSLPQVITVLRDPQIFGPSSYEIKVIIPHGTSLRGVYPNYYFVRECA
jgi:hypothetical protein